VLSKILWAVLGLSFLAISCDRSKVGGAGGASGEVVVYTSVDEPVGRPILDEFTKRTGIKVAAKFDAEASKTAGLVQTIRAERGNPRADVFWNNEIFHTINLAEEGLLAEYDSPAAADVPGHFKDPRHRWAGSAARVRVICFSSAAGTISKVEDLAEPRLKGRVCMANPAFGTTSGQVASWFVRYGEEGATELLRRLKANDVKLLGGNSEVVKQVAAGTMWAGLTDNDDVESAIREGAKDLKWVAARDAKDTGTLAVPCTVGLVARGKNSEAGKKLVDYLLSREVEERLVAGKFAKMSVRGGSEVAPLKIDYREVAKMMPRAIEASRKILEGRE
jgi:iron(III) transport system substrate-binding protein